MKVSTAADISISPKISHRETHQSLLGSDQRSVLAVHLMVQSAGVTQVVACSVPSPQWRRSGSAVYTLPGLCQIGKIKSQLEVVQNKYG